MATVTGNSNITASFTQTKTTGLPGSSGASYTPTFSWTTQTYASSGTAANQVDLMYTASLNLAAAATTLDLTTLTDVFGGTVNFLKVREIWIFNKSATDGQIITVSGGATNAWAGMFNSTGTITIGPSGIFHNAYPTLTGFPVSGTSKTLKLDPGANTITAEILIVGTDA